MPALGQPGGQSGRTMLPGAPIVQQLRADDTRVTFIVNPYPPLVVSPRSGKPASEWMIEQADAIFLGTVMDSAPLMPSSI